MSKDSSPKGWLSSAAAYFIFRLFVGLAVCAAALTIVFVAISSEAHITSWLRLLLITAGLLLLFWGMQIMVARTPRRIESYDDERS